MANEPSVLGTSALVGFPTGETVTGVIRESYDTEQTAEIEPVKDENNNDASMIVSNLGKRITLSGECTAAQTVRKGGLLTINSVVYMVESAVMRRTKTKARFDCTVYKPDATTFTAPT
jgi:hypothetical protein